MVDAVVIVDHDAGWPAAFALLAAPIRAALGELAVAIEHIGSTAVPGLAAKPIIDLEVLVRAAGELPLVIARLGALGYAHEGELIAPGHHAFDWPRPGPRHHLYACVADHPAHRRHVRFRDHLRRHPADAAAYAALKRALASALGQDRAAYTAAKGAFVTEVLARAAP